jgi:hypothetical protein
VIHSHKKFARDSLASKNVRVIHSPNKNVRVIHSHKKWPRNSLAEKIARDSFHSHNVNHSHQKCARDSLHQSD